MDELILKYREQNGGLLIVEIANGYQMVTNPEYSEWVKKFKGAQLSTKLSMPALETLSIIAYKQPIIKVEIEQLRGVNSDSAIKTLLEKRLIKVIGRKEAPGRPFLYGTTGRVLFGGYYEEILFINLIHSIFYFPSRLYFCRHNIHCQKRGQSL